MVRTGLSLGQLCSQFCDDCLISYVLLVSLSVDLLSLFQLLLGSSLGVVCLEHKEAITFLSTVDIKEG